MITTFKIFENLNTPKVGEYVICIYSMSKNHKDLDIFLSQNIGKIIEIRNYKAYTFPYIVEFEHIPNNLKKFTTNTYFDSIDQIVFRRDEILSFNKNKEDLKIFLDTNKYNL